MKRICLLVTSVLLLTSQSRTQVTTAGLTGFVTDQSGAPVPGVQVTAVHTSTGFTRTATTDSDGSYSILLLQIGSYDITTERQGFKKYQRLGFGPLTVAQVGRADIRLELGEITQSVEVTDQAPLVRTTTSETSFSLSSKQLESLPISLQRNPFYLVRYLPGVDFLTAPGFTMGLQFGSIISANGSRWNQSNFQFDGGNFNTQSLGLGMAYPSQESLEEFKFISHSYSAEFGRNSGTVVSGVTKSGTNDLHGSLYLFHNDKSANARSYFNPRRGDTNQNDFGGTLGGPIKKDKLFYFVSTRFLRQQLTSFFPPYVSPDANIRKGDFSLVPTPIIDPTTGSPFPGNIIPQNRLDPVAQKILQVVPLPGAGGLVFPEAPAPQNEDMLVGKSDYVISSRDRINVRYYWQRTNIGGGFAGQVPEYATNDIQSWTHDINGHYTKNFSPNILNDFMVEYRHLRSYLSTKEKFDLIDLGVDPSVGKEGISGPPNFNVIGGIFAGGTGGQEEWGRLYQFRDTLSWIRNRHQLKFGMEFMLNYYELQGGFLTNGAYTFQGTNTGNAYADFVIGRPQVFSRFSRDFVNYKNPSYYWFVQDDFKVTRNLTLNLGFRYEINIPPTVVPDNQQATYKEGAVSKVYPNAPRGLVYPTLGGVAGDVIDGLYPTPKGNLEPRFGFAWDPFGDSKTVIRGAYGLYSEVTLPSNVSLTRSNRPFVLRHTVINPLGGTINPYLGIDPKPFPFTRPAPGDLSVQFPGLTSIAGISADYVDPQIQHINLTFERQIGTNFAYEVGYVGTLGHHLQWYQEANPALCPTQLGQPMPLDPDGSGRPYCRADNINQRRRFPVPLNPAERNQSNSVTSIGLLSSDGNSTYHGMQMAFRKRMSQGLMFDWNWTWSKAIDDTTNYIVAGVVAPNPQNRRADRGPSDWTHAHVTNLTAVYELPRFKNMTPIPRQVIGGWNISGTFKAQSGDRVTIVTGLDSSLDGLGNDRPNLVGNPNGITKQLDGRVGPWIDPAAFALPANGTYGNLGRGTVLGPGYWNVDLGIYKDFYLTERIKFQVRADFYNALNHANFGVPFNIVAVAPAFGRITTAQPGRSIQFAGRLTW